jgi:hypothetical protein
MPMPIERLEMLADLWGRIYLFHPNLPNPALGPDLLRHLRRPSPVLKKLRLRQSSFGF